MHESSQSPKSIHSTQKDPIPQPNQGPPYQVLLPQKSSPAPKDLPAHTKIPQPPQSPSKHQMTSATYFTDMLNFLTDCKHDKRLLPMAQLMYRVLVSLYNANFWTTPIVVSDTQLKEIMHISSASEITRLKRHLKNLGYIDFFGKPSHYIIYAPTAWRSVQRSVQNQPPKPPDSTNKLYNQTILCTQSSSTNLRSDARDDFELSPKSANLFNPQQTHLNQSTQLDRSNTFTNAEQSKLQTEAAKLLDELKLRRNRD